VTGAHRGLDIEAVSGSIAAHAKSRAAPLDAAGRDFRLAGLGRLPGEGGALSPRRLYPDYHGAVKPITLATTMTTATREEFSSQAAPELLAALRQIADSQGRQFQAVLDEALRDYLDRHQQDRPRRHVMASFAESLVEFDSLYRELAK
jgi:hypothetical protein